MKKFKYRLQALLRVKEHIEKERQKVHAVAVQKVHQQTDELDRIHDSRQENLSSQRRQMTQHVSVAEMLVYSRYLTRLKREQLAGTELLNVLKGEAEEKRVELVAAAKDRRVLEKLKEKQSTKHHAEIDQAMTKENDEIALICHRRKEEG
ncbi:MAG: flagellar export protein FliJ [candidate division Zixibacteria bacterium]|nr:flagellar export protein FliJ [candidate division Zixibacteria bacterium]MDH3937975.1 flagellar export protein FliJ [candidate division Zixibacteria bacterium]MDH4035844.1 flagellar export protein FliJ [candidate division Zixibacteria bacterium]